jgi:hypothetical protein
MNSQPVLYKFELKEKQMNTKLLIAAAFTVLCLTACQKDKFTTKPQLTFKSVNTQVLYPNQLIQFTIHYTDREGDIQNTIFYIQKVTLNCSATGSSFVDSMQLTPANVPKQNDAEGDVIVRYLYGVQTGYATLTGPRCAWNDTCYFRFALRDAAKNSSDTVMSPQIVIIKN